MIIKSVTMKCPSFIILFNKVWSLGSISDDNWDWEIGENQSEMKGKIQQLKGKLIPIQFLIMMH